MKLSKREKILIIILIFVSLIYMVYKFVPLKPSININESLEEHKNVLNSYETMTQNIKMKKIYEEKEQELLDEISDLNVETKINQDKIIEMLNIQLSDCSIKAKSISFTEVASFLQNSDEDKINIEPSEDNESTIVLMSVNIEFLSNYNDMITFIDKIQSNSNDIAITNIHIVNGEENLVNCVIDLNFYAMK